MGTTSIAKGQNYISNSSGGVTSFNSRTGVVAPTTGDYTQAQITGSRTTPALVTSTIVWTGGTAPSGTLTSGYTWSKMGGFCFFQLILAYSVAGLTDTSVNIDLPSDMPVPTVLAGQTANGSILSAVTGLLGSNLTTSTASARGTINADTTSATGYKIELTGAASTSADSAFINGFYACSN